MPRRLLLPLLLACACAPAQQRLLADRNYLEALAGVDQGALDGGVVLATIAADLQVGLHLQAIPADAVRAQLPGTSPTLDDLAVVRAIHDANHIPIYHLDVGFALLQNGVPIALPDPAPAALASSTGEPVPEARVVHVPADSHYRPVSKTRFPLAEMFGRVVFNVVTVGTMHEAVPIVEAVKHDAYTTVIEPTDLDYARVSPNAYSVHKWLADPGCRTVVDRCTRHLLWPRTTGPLELAVFVHLEATAAPTIVYRIPLPAGPLDEALRATFGDQVRSLETLARAAGVRPQVSYQLDIFEYRRGKLTRSWQRRLCRLIRGTRHHPGLKDRRDLRFTLEVREPDDEDVKQSLELRKTLLACGVPASAIALDERGPADFALRVSHSVDPVDPPP